MDAAPKTVSLTCKNELLNVVLYETLLKRIRKTPVATPAEHIERPISFWQISAICIKIICMRGGPGSVRLEYVDQRATVF
jgi:hypothetical protein